MPLPPISQEPILTMDLTPTPDLAIRILQAYRENCDVLWTDNSLWVDGMAGFVPPPEGSWMARMNEDQKSRAKILDMAILLLEAASGADWPFIGNHEGD